MAQAFASSEWVDQLWSTLRSDDAVRRAGATWAHGPVAIRIEGDPEAGFAGSCIRIDMHEGEARDVRATDLDASTPAPFVLTGTYVRWKELFGSGGDLLAAILASHVRLRGDLPALNRHRDLWRAVMRAAAKLDTSWQDESAAAQQPATSRS